MSICSSVLFMFGNENKLKLENLKLHLHINAYKSRNQNCEHFEKKWETKERCEAGSMW